MSFHASLRLLSISLLVFHFACNNSSLTGGSEGPSNRDAQTANASRNAGKPNSREDTGNGGTSGLDTGEGGELGQESDGQKSDEKKSAPDSKIDEATFYAKACPPKNQDLLILDFRSGWWSGGGGGTFFQTILDGLTSPCGGSLTIEYHHFETQQPEKAVYPARASNPDPWVIDRDNLDAYSQIWVLSGSNSDVTDVQTNSEFFTQLAQRIAASKTSLLIGAGDGFLDHGNALGALLGLGTLFQASQIAQPIPIGPTANVVDWLNRGREFNDHVLFTGVTTIANQIETGGRIIRGDSVAGSGVQAIARGPDGNPVIATAAIGARRVVIDAGLQRFYALLAPSGGDTFKYLQNIAIYLNR